jgi:hypothetical protein
MESIICSIGVNKLRHDHTGTVLPCFGGLLGLKSAVFKTGPTRLESLTIQISRSVQAAPFGPGWSRPD